MRSSEDMGTTYLIKRFLVITKKLLDNDIYIYTVYRIDVPCTVLGKAGQTKSQVQERITAQKKNDNS